MNNMKIQCNKCGAKFFSLNREEITCKCGNHILVDEYLKKQDMHNKKSSKEENNENSLDLDDNLFEEEEISF